MERCESTYCGKLFLDAQKKQSERLAKTWKMPKNVVNSMMKRLATKKSQNETKKACKKAYCNPGCKDTLFQPGSPTDVPKSLYESFKGDKAVLKKFLTGARKTMFGKEKNVLKGDFFKRMKPANVTRIKKQGALSGCSLIPMT